MTNFLQVNCPSTVITSRRMTWVRYVALMGDIRNAYNNSVGKHEGKIPLGRSRRRWDDYITTDHREVGW